MKLTSESQSKFLGLPLEIREGIYDELLDCKKNEQDLGQGLRRYKFDLKIFLVNRQVYHEAQAVFRRKNIFVAIETPWPEASDHAAAAGQVPLVVRDLKADGFRDCYMTVVIDSPHHISFSQITMWRFIVLLDDLPLFTLMWDYQDLSHDGLNKHLRLALKLRHPYIAENDDSPIPKALQKRLLEPFGIIKDLNELTIEGNHYPSLEKSLREEMSKPHKSPEDCLADCSRLKDEGNVAIRKQLYHEAIRLYVEAFRAIHIVCNGRVRHIWGDDFFKKELVGGQFDKQEGLIVRLVLRVKLVANIVQAYIKLEEYGEAQFWGMRTITMMRDALDDQDYMPGFVAGDSMGKIFYRTGLAYKALGDKDEARGLFRTAEKYLPHDMSVKKALASVALRLG